MVKPETCTAHEKGHTIFMPPIVNGEERRRAKFPHAQEFP
jgi:hypothetical protein